MADDEAGNEMSRGKYEAIEIKNVVLVEKNEEVAFEDALILTGN